MGLIELRGIYSRRGGHAVSARRHDGYCTGPLTISPSLVASFSDRCSLSIRRRCASIHEALR